MDWMQILSALGIAAMIVIFYPAVKYRVKESPGGDTNDWLAFAVAALAVVGFVLFLISTL